MINNSDPIPAPRAFVDPHVLPLLEHPAYRPGDIAAWQHYRLTDSPDDVEYRAARHGITWQCNCSGVCVQRPRDDDDFPNRDGVLLWSADQQLIVSHVVRPDGTLPHAVPTPARPEDWRMVDHPGPVTCDICDAAAQRAWPEDPHLLCGCYRGCPHWPACPEHAGGWCAGQCDWYTWFFAHLSEPVASEMTDRP